MGTDVSTRLVGSYSVMRRTDPRGEAWTHVVRLHVDGAEYEWASVSGSPIIFGLQVHDLGEQVIAHLGRDVVMRDAPASPELQADIADWLGRSARGEPHGLWDDPGTWRRIISDVD